MITQSPTVPAEHFIQEQRALHQSPSVIHPHRGQRQPGSRWSGDRALATAPARVLPSAHPCAPARGGPAGRGEAASRFPRNAQQTPSRDRCDERVWFAGRWRRRGKGPWAPRPRGRCPRPARLWPPLKVTFLGRRSRSQGFSEPETKGPGDRAGRLPLTSDRTQVRGPQPSRTCQGQEVRDRPSPPTPTR